MIDTTFFPGARIFWYKGELYDWDSVTVHVMSHALHYGSSVFEGIRAYNTPKGPAVFRLPDHLDRFMISAEILNMKVPYTKEQIADAIRLVMKKNRLRDAYIRPLLYFGYGNLGLVPKACPVELIIGCWNWGAYLGEETLQKGAHVMLLPMKRIHHSQIDQRAKLGGMYVQSNIAGSLARKHGFDEGLFLNLEGRIAEGPGENVFIVKNGVVKTNDISESILEGITRTTILELARDLGFPTKVEPITLEEFLDADEAFFTGTAAEVTPITRYTDGREQDRNKEDWFTKAIGNGKPGEITLKLAKLYKEVVSGKHPQYDHWLTYVYDSEKEMKQYMGDVEEGEKITRF